MGSNTQHFLSIKYRPDIDGLRAISIACVIGFHSFPNLFPAGFIGVDIFFVISGFLITGIILCDLRLGNFSFLEFYRRRVFRILPALLLVLFVSIALGWILLLPNEYKSLGRHLIAASTFTSNLLLWYESGYFDSINDLKPLLHLWSLGVEEQFYFLWPFALYFLYKLRINLWVGLALIIVGSFCLSIYYSKGGSPFAFYFPLTRFWELGTGGVAALVIESKRYQDLQDRHSNFFQFASVFGCILIAVGLCIINKNSNFPGWLATLPVIGTCMVIAGGSNKFINRYVLSNPLLVYVGLISYPLYLWHWPLLSFYRIVDENHVQINLVLMIIAISIFLAALTRSILEVRILRDQKTFSLLLMLLAIVGAIGFSIESLEGYGSRGSVSKFSVAIQNNKLTESFFKNNSECIKNKVNVATSAVCAGNFHSPEILIIGDSHAAAFSSALFNEFGELKNLSAKTLLLSDHGCLPFSSRHLTALRSQTSAANRESCELLYMAAKGAIDKYSTLKYVVIATREVSYYSKNDLDRNYWSGYSDLITDITSKGKNAIFIIDNPVMPEDVFSCIGRPFYISRAASSCVQEYELVLGSRVAYHQKIMELKNNFQTLMIFDLPKLVFCKDGNCIGTLNNIPLYYDRDHINLLGSKIALREFNKFIYK